MRRIFAIAAVVAALVMSVSALRAATFKSANVSITAPTIEYTGGGMNLKGGAHVDYVDPITNARMVADAKEIVIALLPSSGGKETAASSIRQATMKGGVHVVYTGVEKKTGSKVKMDCKCDNAVYTGADQLARLNGNVRIEYTDPSRFDGPSVISGDKATVNTKTDLAEDELRFRIESSPGLSKVEITPKQEKNDENEAREKQ